jgi:hypothetical protein
MSSIKQGTIVKVTAFGGEILTRRVWEDVGNVILICREDTYQQALQDNEDPTCTGFPKEDIVEIVEEVQP